MKNAVTERNPKFYELNPNFSLNNVIQQMNVADDNSLINNSEDDKLIFTDAMALIKKNANNKFTLKSRIKYENLIKTPVYIKADVRLKFPNSFILEGSFTLFETVGDIYNFVKEYLKNPNNKFTISTSPPPKKYEKLGDTLYSQKLYPQVLMYVNCDNFEGLDESKIEPIKVDIQSQ